MFKGVYKNADFSFDITDIPSRREPARVLMSSPEYFDIVDEKNVHMAGQIGKSDKNAVKQQWQSLYDSYAALKEEGVLEELSVVPGAEGCEDMVFCANQSFPWVMEDGTRVVVMSKMRHPSRQREVPFFQEFYEKKGFMPLHFDAAINFEGMGDVIPHPAKRLLYGGYGHRTSAAAYEELAGMLQVPVIALELVNPKFYHLDTCFVPISTDSVMLCKEAFNETGLEMISKLFRHVHLIPEEEAEKFFSLNVHAFEAGGKKVAILQKGSTVTKKLLQDEGFRVIELETSEFMKSGGSVFCMKMMYP